MNNKSTMDEINQIEELLGRLKIDKRTQKQKEIDKLFNPDKNGVSEWISKETIKTKSPFLDWGSNGVMRHNIMWNDTRYNWDVKRGSRRNITDIKTTGFNKNELSKKSRPINKQIEKEIKKSKSKCVFCGTKTNLVCDHKNDLYNDEIVLNIKEQRISDFQCLCNRCNLLKREICKKEKEKNKIYSAKNIPFIGNNFKFEYPWEKKAFDILDINCKKDTFWYDPVEFVNKLNLYKNYRIPINNMVKKNIKLLNN